MIGAVLIILLVVLFIVITNVYLSWVRRKCPEPIVIDNCPPCPKCPEMPEYPDPNSELLSQNDNLKAMVRYLTLIVKKYEAEKELYKLSHGYHQVYNSPKMEYLKKEIHRMIRRIKSDPGKTNFFEKHLNGIIE